MVRIIHSTLAADDVGRLISIYFPVKTVATCRLLKRRFNDTYEVTTDSNERFILRISARRGRNVSDLTYEIDFLRHLAKHDVPVAEPVKTLEGSWWHCLDLPERTRPAVLFKCAPGRSPNPTSASDAHAQGATLAMIHNAADKFQSSANRFQLDIGHLLTRPLAKLLSLSIATTEVRSYLENLAARLVIEIERIGDTLSRSHCHGDCHGWNARISDVGQHAPIATFFDFDDSGPGWTAYDLAVFLWSTKTYMKIEREALWPEFLEGYRKIRAISTTDLNALPSFVAIRHFWLMGEYAERSDEWGAELFDRTWLDQQVLLLRDWIQK